MVGDDRRADGGAEAIGIRTFFVDPVPVQDRPDGFAPLLAEAGIGRDDARPGRPQEWVGDR
jgi:putative hydrolase of the HAD superfamily